MRLIFRVRICGFENLYQQDDFTTLFLWRNKRPHKTIKPILFRMDKRAFMCVRPFTVGISFRVCVAALQTKDFKHLNNGSYWKCSVVITCVKHRRTRAKMETKTTKISKKHIVHIIVHLYAIPSIPIILYTKHECKRATLCGMWHMM